MASLGSRIFKTPGVYVVPQFDPLPHPTVNKDQLWSWWVLDISDLYFVSEFLYIISLGYCIFKRPSLLVVPRCQWEPLPHSTMTANTDQLWSWWVLHISVLYFVFESLYIFSLCYRVFERPRWLVVPRWEPLPHPTANKDQPWSWWVLHISVLYFVFESLYIFSLGYRVFERPRWLVVPRWEPLPHPTSHAEYLWSWWVFYISTLYFVFEYLYMTSLGSHIFDPPWTFVVPRRKPLLHFTSHQITSDLGDFLIFLYFIFHIWIHYMTSLASRIFVTPGVVTTAAPGVLIFYL